MDEHVLYYLVGVPLLGIGAQWLAWRLRLPSILLLLLFGMLLGRLIQPGDVFGESLLFPVVSLAVAVILFEGGLTLRIGELKDSGGVVFRLVTLGALVSWALTMAAAYTLLGGDSRLDFRLAALIGAVLVVTGPTVVAPLLRHIRPVRRVGSVAKWEGIVIDPIGAIAAVLIFEQAFPAGGHAEGWIGALVAAGECLVIGGVLGVGVGFLLVEIVKRYWLPDYLHGVVFLTVALGVFAASNWFQHESGLVTVTVLGVFLANQRSIPVRHIVEFKEHLGVFLISCLFIVLGSRLELEQLLQLGSWGFWFLAVMLLVVRPASVMLATLGTELQLRERIFLSFLAPRGIVAAAVASVFAIRLETQLAGQPLLAQQADQLVPITFLVIVGTVSFYGLLAAPLARFLGLADPKPQGILFAGAEPWVKDAARMLMDEGFQTFVVDTNYAHVAQMKMHGIPADCSSILSEHVRDEIDLSGIGRLLAVTSNDEVNALAVREFAHVFGRAEVFQLPPPDTGAGKRASVGQHLRGRLAFDAVLHYEELKRRYQGQQVLKKTQITKEFSYADFRDMYGESTIALFVIDDAKNLVISTADEPVQPVAGETVIALVDVK